MKLSVGIIGGGAAGMVAAIAAARQGADITLFERNDRLGKKILATGNGKCNLGNEKLDVEEYHTNSPAFLENCLERFGTADTVSFFQGIGLMVKSKNGLLYPVCEQAAAVLDVLRCEVAALGVQVITDCMVDQISRNPSECSVTIRGNGKNYSFYRVIIACGGKAAPKTGSDGNGYRLAKQIGHSLIPTVPALVQLRCREDYFKAVAGVRADAVLAVWYRGKCVAQERGELQLTDYGISGIPVFQLSRVVNDILAGRKDSGGTDRQETVEVSIDFLPEYSQEAFERFCAGRLLLQGERTVEEFFTGMLHKKLMMLFIKLAGLKPTETIGKADQNKVRQVYRLCREWKVHVTGSNSYDNAQVSAGGVPLEEVTEHLESKKTPGVYFAGEILDVDGRCGGYNLQWAWCSGYLAGCAAAQHEKMS